MCAIRFMCVTWLVRTCDMAHSYVCHDSFICVTHTTTLFYRTQGMMCGIRFMCVTSLLHMYDMTHSYVCCVTFMCVPRVYSIANRIRCVWYCVAVCCSVLQCVAVCRCATSLFYRTQDKMCGIRRTRVTLGVFDASFVCHDSCTRVSCLLHMCVLHASIFRLPSSIFYLPSSIFYLPSSVFYQTQSNMCGIRFNPKPRTTHLHVWHDSFIRVLRRIHMCATSLFYRTQSKMCGIRFSAYASHLLSSIYYLLSSIFYVLSSILYLPSSIFRSVRCARYDSVWMISPPKNGLIALWSATNRWYIVKCVLQKLNRSNNKYQWYNILVTFINQFS